MSKRKLDNRGQVSKVSKLSAFGFKSSNIDDKCVENTVPSLKDNEKTPTTCDVTRPTVSVSRKFKDCWMFGRSWLKYDARLKKMFCTVCLESELNNTFTTGCSVMKKDLIIKHESSKGDNSHASALCALKESVNMERVRELATNKSKSAIVAALRNVHFAAVNLPNALVPRLNKLCIAQGSAHLNDLNVDHHTNYSHNSSIQGLQKSLADVIEDTLIEQINKSELFSLMLDESTDVSVHQNMIVYIRFLQTICGTCIAQTEFLGIKQLDVADAETITTALLDMLKSKDIDVDGLVGVSTDGASVMTGLKSGVVARLKKVKPSILSTHCIAHRLALGCGAAADKVRYLVKFQEVLNSMYKYFEKHGQVEKYSGNCQKQSGH